MRSGHGVGKSALLAWAVLWWLLTRSPAKVACTAPTAHQLEDILWGEIAKWSRRLSPPLKAQLALARERLVMVAAPGQSFAVARTARRDQPEAFQGFHSEAMLFVVDDQRVQWNDKEWFAYGTGSGPVTAAPTAVFVSATSFKIAGADVTAAYQVGRRVRATGALTGTLYGTITAAAFATDTTVTVAWDTGALVSEALTVSLGAALAGRPGLTAQAQAPSVKTAAYTVVPGDHNRLIRAQTGSTGFTVTLPVAATGAFPGMIVKLRHDSGSGLLTVAPGASDRIFWPAPDSAGYATLLLPGIGDTVTLESDGVASWFITHERIRTECRVDRNGANQGVGPGAVVKIQFTNRSVDTHGFFDATTNFRFQPQIPGVYAVMMAGRQDSLGTGSVVCSVNKNGSDVLNNSDLFEGAGGVRDLGGIALAEMNGTSDYLEAFWLNGDVSSSRTILGSAHLTYMHIIRVG